MQNYVGALTIETETREIMGPQSVGANLRTGRYNFYDHTLEINFNRTLLFCWVADAYPELIKTLGVENYEKVDLWCRSTFFEKGGVTTDLQRATPNRRVLQRSKTI